MTARPPHPDDFVSDGVNCPGRVCRLITSTLTDNVRTAYQEYGRVDLELVAWVRAVELAGERWTSYANASESTSPPAGPPNSQSDLLSTSEAAELLGCKAPNVRDLVRRHRITPARTSPYLFERAEINRLIRTRKSA